MMGVLCVSITSGIYLNTSSTTGEWYWFPFNKLSLRKTMRSIPLIPISKQRASRWENLLSLQICLFPPFQVTSRCNLRHRMRDVWCVTLTLSIHFAFIPQKRSGASCWSFLLCSSCWGRCSYSWKAGPVGWGSLKETALVGHRARGVQALPYVGIHIYCICCTHPTTPKVSTISWYS